MRILTASKSGEERYDVVFPKYKKGGYVVREVVVKPTYGMLIVLPNIYSTTVRLLF